MISAIPKALASALATSARAQFTTVLLAVGMAKLVILLIDPMPRFFLWDSVTYLQGALGGPLPRDRSFLYSLLIAATAVPAHSLLALVVAQTIAGTIAALLVYAIVRNFLHAPFAVALVAAVALALAPSQLFYERMVMAEAFGGMLWMTFVAIALAYVRDGRAVWLPALAAAGICTIAFRLNGTGVIACLSAGVPLIRAAWLRRSPTHPGRLAGREVLLQFGLALACTVAAHAGYRHVVAHVAHTQPGYIGTEGLFMLGFVAPAITAADFAGTGCSAAVLGDVRAPLGDSRTREFQLWGTGGLWTAMQQDCPQPEHAADIVAHRAFARIPALLLPMALTTVAQYFDDTEATWRMNSDLGRKGMLPLELIEPAQQYFGLDVRPIAFTDTLTSIAFEHARWWLAGCFLLSPLFALALAWRFRGDRAAGAALLLAVILGGLFLTQFLLSPIIAFRYLHPFPPLVVICVAALASRRRTATHAAPVPSATARLADLRR